MTTINAGRVEEILKDCLFDDDATEFEFVEAEGIMNRFGLDPEKLEIHREEIIEILSHLPAPFFRDSGGGWSFLQMPFTAEDEHWGEHVNAEQLMVLGIAIGKIEYMVPRDLWSTLPGGMPYLVISR